MNYLIYPLLLSAFFAGVQPAQAGLVLTSAGTSLGFSLTTFVSGYNANYGPLSQGILPDGNVIAGSQFNQQLYIFADTDNQTLGSALASIPYACQTSNCNFAMATAGGQVYGAQAFGGVLYHFSNNGTATPVPNLQGIGLTEYLGMWANPVNGHLIASTNQGLVDIDPVAGTYRVINSSLFPDGVSVSPDGTVAYLAIGAGVQSYSIATGALIATFGLGGGPDGTGVISGGALNGRVVVNLNNGTVVLLDPTKPSTDPNQIIVIATGGTRGDFVSADTSNGTLFLSQNEDVVRLACGTGCDIGGGLTLSPEPSSLVMLCIGVVAVAVGAIRRRKRTA